MTKQNNQSEVKEIWVLCKFINHSGVVEEYPNYEVSNLGRIRTLNYNHSGKSKVLKHVANAQSNGIYYRVSLCKNMRIYSRLIHRLVLSSFNLKGYFRGAVADHVNSNTEDNRLKNLRWTTQQENINTPHRKALMINHPGLSKRVQITFLDDSHTEILPSGYEVERTLGLPKHTVASCIHNRSGHYKRLNLLFEYI